MSKSTKLGVCYYGSPWGRLRLAAGDGVLWCLSLGEIALGDDESLVAPEADEVLSETVAWLDGYVSGQELARPPICWKRGSVFQRAVWEECAAIPWGQTKSYGQLAADVAQRLGNRPCARAVGQALKSNPWAVIVPCHRVIGARGRLGGYAYGSALKASLLLHEGIEDLSGRDSVAEKMRRIF